MRLFNLDDRFDYVSEFPSLVIKTSSGSCVISENYQDSIDIISNNERIAKTAFRYTTSRFGQNYRFCNDYMTYYASYTDSYIYEDYLEKIQ